MDSNLVIILAALLVGLAKGGLGGMAGALVSPLFSTIMPISTAVGLTLPLLMVGDLFALRFYWRKWDMKHIRLLLPAAVIGIVGGALLLTHLPDEVLRRLLGLFSLMVVGYKIGSASLKSLSYAPHDWHGYVAGWTAGFGSALANAGGPPFTAYMLLQKVPPLVFVGTSTLFFAIVNVLKLPIFLTASVIDVPQLVGIAWALPLIPLGVWIGRSIVRRMDARVFEWFMLATLLWMGLSLLFG
jgi:uncharacterized membrane protein YfcA